MKRTSNEGPDTALKWYHLRAPVTIIRTSNCTGRSEDLLSVHINSESESDGPGLWLKVRNENFIFLFLNQNICCGYSKEPSQ